MYVPFLCWIDFPQITYFPTSWSFLVSHTQHHWFEHLAFLTVSPLWVAITFLEIINGWIIVLITLSSNCETIHCINKAIFFKSETQIIKKTNLKTFNSDVNERTSEINEISVSILKMMNWMPTSIGTQWSSQLKYI